MPVARLTAALVLSVLIASGASAQSQTVLYPGLSGQPLLDAIGADYRPTQTLGYDTARDSLFAREQRLRGALRCVYTGFSVSLTPGADPSSDASARGINTEHTWPQSRGASAEPSRGDMHHLFPTRENANSARGSSPFAEIPDAQTDAWYRLAATQSATPSVALDEWSEKDNATVGGFQGRFEPREDHAGNTARAMFYYRAVYPDRVQAAGSAAFFEAQQADLLDWHVQDPVDAEEADRSAWIASKQGTSNPFVLDSTLARRAFNPTGGGGPGEPPAGALAAFLNEIHYDQGGVDTGEFVEVAVRADVDPATVTVTLYNGSGGVAYGTPETVATFAPGASAGAYRLYTRTYPTDGLQNGGPDGLALSVGSTVVQFLSYEGTFAASDGVASGLTSVDIGVAEGGGTQEGESLQLRGTGASYPDFTWTAPMTASPGAVNTGQAFSVGVTVEQTLADAAGYRLLSVPVEGVSVSDLAAVNLVQGVSGGAVNGPQYPTGAIPNLYTTLTDAGYGAPADTDVLLAPGRGFFWQFYDTDLVVASPETYGGGTSQGYALPARRLTATGPEVTSSVSVGFEENDDQFYMIGNPFARPVAASAITSDLGIQGGVFQAYSPVGGYEVIAQTAMGSEPTALGVWQGVFAETVGAGSPTFTFDATAAVPEAPAFVGRPAGGIASGIALVLTGVTASGAQTIDRAAFVRFAEGASDGWDALDASKQTPPGAPYALVAPTVERLGAACRVALDTRPAPNTEARIPLAVTTTDAGVYTLSADASGLPAGWTATLHDTETGEIAAGGITFELPASDWSSRFVLVVQAGRATSADAEAPGVATLAGPFPNPAPASARLALTVPRLESVTATVVDALGRTVATLIDGPAVGDINLRVDTSRLAPGVYVVRIAGETFQQSRRLVVAR